MDGKASTTTNKETVEFVRFPAAIINGTYRSLEDGTFNLKEDFPNYLPVILSAEGAIKGMKEIKTENANMTNPQKVEVREAIFNAMPDVPDSDRHDITEMLSGTLSAFRIGWRKGQKELIKDLQEGRISLEDLV